MEGSGAVLRYYNAAGKQVASAPAALKRGFGSELLELRAAAKGLDQLLARQKARLESLLLASRRWTLSTWRERYLDHPVVGTLARRLLWTVNETTVVPVGNQLTGVRGEAVPESASGEVRLWHPLGRTLEEVAAWRERLEQLGIRQPFKQAHREIYMLTEAERRTGTYSNRFAAHVLRQSQFRALAVARQWRAPFLGGWDGGDAGAATRALPDNWRAEFWVSAIGEQYGESGGLLHVSTDQVRFHRGTEVEPAALDQVPALLFSEAMRDIDLFVGVASVGNDPAWQDGGPQGRYRQYWQNYSFGELSASAETRKQALARLVPKLRIANRCLLLERFLVVKGALRTYKIHLGSSNILMEPNDQYLCIVPDQRAKRNQEVASAFLPFEGDNTLSLILSKAFLLAEDNKIKDAAILRQIHSHTPTQS